MSVACSRSGREPTDRHARGVSLAEIIIGLGLLAMLIKSAAPSFSDFAGKSRLTSSVSTLVADLNYARGEAIMRRAPVIVCAKVRNSSSCAATPNWEAGWVVCVDANQDNVCDITSAAAPNPIRVRNAVNSTTVITASAAALRFSSIGAASGNGAFTIAGGSAALPSRSIQINSNGNVQTN